MRNVADQGPQRIFGQIDSVTLTARVIEALKEAFFSGKFRPGDAIVERQLAREMNVGTPVIREALISLKHEGFVRRVTNKGSYVTKFETDEVEQLYALRIELETLALQWARPRVTPDDLAELASLADRLVEAGKKHNRAEFLRLDLEFHRFYWKLSGNPFLADVLERLMAPLFAFVVLASEVPLTAAMGRDHYLLVDALRSMREPEFTEVVRKTLTKFALRWVGSVRGK